MSAQLQLAPDDTASTPRPARPRADLNRVFAWSTLAALLAIGVWSIAALGIDPAAMVRSFDNAVDFVGRIFPLDFPPLGELLAMTVQTLAIVVLATALAVVLGLIVAVFAASNTTLNNATRVAARVIIVVMRAVPDLILAMIFFRLFGIGALPGILALGLHSIGMVGKLYADAIEEIDQGPSEAVRAAGGGRIQWITATVIPTVMPQIIATALHRFDINLRTSVLLGYVGVGGIGLELSQALGTMQYQRGMALAVVILVLVLAVEMLSGAIRARIMGRTGSGRGPLAFLDRVAAGWVLKPASGFQAQRTRAGRVRVSPPWDGGRIARTLGIVATLVILAMATLFSGVDLSQAGASLLDLPRVIDMFLPPTPQDLLDRILEAMLVTIQIGFAATTLGLVLAVPIGVLAARNVAPNPVVANVFRAIIVIIRAIPDLIVAIILIVVTGMGPVPGTLALALGSVGLLGKLVADSIEETDVRVQDALRATGAGPAQVFFGATLRQALPQLIAHYLYQLDVNIRSATLLGVVGAGGIGFLLLGAARVLQFDVVSFIILLILATVLAIEGIALWLRRALR